MATNDRFNGICIITAANLLPGRTHLDVARAAVAAGVAMVQFREKLGFTRDLCETARRIRQLASGTPTRFIVNDRLDIALAVDADGVHLGPEDLPWEIARKLLGPDRILGVSAATPEEVERAEKAGADYLGVGPAFATGSKADAGDALGPEGIARIAALTELPVVAIGGITPENAPRLRPTGARGIAVIGAVAGAESMAPALQALKDSYGAE